MKCLALGNLENQHQQKALTFLRSLIVMQVRRPVLTTTYWLCNFGKVSQLPCALVFSSVKWKSNSIYLTWLLAPNYFISAKHLKEYLECNWPTIVYELLQCLSELWDYEREHKKSLLSWVYILVINRMSSQLMDTHVASFL